MYIYDVISNYLFLSFMNIEDAKQDEYFIIAFSIVVLWALLSKLFVYFGLDSNWAVPF